MMDWLQSLVQPWFIWAIVGLVLILAEFALPGLIVIFFGVGALVVAALVSLVEVSLFVQLLVFLVVSVALLIGLRRTMRRVFMGRRRDGGVDTGRGSDFEGERAVVAEAIPENGVGRVELHGTEWDAEANDALAAGSHVVIVGQAGSTLKVRKQG